MVVLFIILLWIVWQSVATLIFSVAAPASSNLIKVNTIHLAFVIKLFVDAALLRSPDLYVDWADAAMGLTPVAVVRDQQK